MPHGPNIDYFLIWKVVNAYLYDAWNRLDFFLVVISLFALYMGEDSDIKVL